MKELENVLKALDKALEEKDLHIFMLQLENDELKKQIAQMKGEKYGEQTISI